MLEIKTVAVFCGAQPGNSPVYVDAARNLGRGLAQAGMALVFGGGSIGLMGAVADAALEAGGRLIGVIPDFLKRREVAFTASTELVVTDSMHTRKRLMFDQADAFVSLPGGLGTLDETIEIITWRQLGLHDKPILFCDIAGSAAPLVSAIEWAISAGFAQPDVRGLYEVTPGVDSTLARLDTLTARPASTSARL